MFKSRLKKYMEDNFTEVLQTTFNPNGPGSIRIHLAVFKVPLPMGSRLKKIL